MDPEGENHLAAIEVSVPLTLASTTMMRCRLRCSAVEYQNTAETTDTRVELLCSSCSGEIQTTGNNNLHGADSCSFPTQLQEQDHGASKKTRYAPNGKNSLCTALLGTMYTSRDH